MSTAQHIDLFAGDRSKKGRKQLINYNFQVEGPFERTDPHFLHHYL